jgi:hypothetical protein
VEQKGGKVMATKNEESPIVAGEKRSTSMMVGLPGCSGPVFSVNVTTMTDALACLGRCRSVNAADSEGCVIVYRDDTGQLWCNFQRYLRDLSKEPAESLAEVRRWLRQWWPKMREADE